MVDCCDATENAADIDSLSADLVLMIPGADEISGLLLTRAVREFCERSRAWRLQSLSTVVGADATSITMPTINDARILQIEDIYIFHADQTESHLVESRRPLQSEILAVDCPMWFAPNPREVVFSNTFGAETTLKIEISMIPTGTTIDESLLQRYREPILAGAMSYAYEMVGKDFYDKNQSRYKRAQFLEGVTKAASFWAATPTAGRPYRGRNQYLHARAGRDTRSYNRYT